MPSFIVEFGMDRYILMSKTILEVSSLMLGSSTDVLTLRIDQDVAIKVYLANEYSEGALQDYKNEVL